VSFENEAVEGGGLGGACGGQVVDFEKDGGAEAARLFAHCGEPFKVLSSYAGEQQQRKRRHAVEYLFELSQAGRRRPQCFPTRTPRHLASRLGGRAAPHRLERLPAVLQVLADAEVEYAAGLRPAGCDGNFWT